MKYTIRCKPEERSGKDFESCAALFDFFEEKYAIVYDEKGAGLRVQYGSDIFYHLDDLQDFIIAQRQLELEL